MKKHYLFSLAILLMSFTTTSNPNFYDYSIQGIDGELLDLSSYKGKVVVIVNVARESPLINQLASFETFYKKYKSQGLVVIACPSDTYGHEPHSDKEIRSFYRSKYRISYNISTKIEVMGKNQHQLFQFLTTKEKNGVEDISIKMDYHKFIIDKSGNLVKNIEPSKDIMDKDILSFVETLF